MKWTIVCLLAALYCIVLTAINYALDRHGLATLFAVLFAANSYYAGKGFEEFFTKK